MSKANLEYNVEGKPIRLHELDIKGLAKYLMDNKVRTTQGKLIMPLHEGHIEVLDDVARYKVLACGRRWGKTLISSLIALAVLMQVNRRVWVVAPDYGLAEKVFRELYSILVTQLKLVKPGKPNGGRARYQKGDYYIQTPWGSVLEAKSMENPDSLAGEANDLVIVDEAALNGNVDDIWMQMIQPTLMDKEGSAVLFLRPVEKMDSISYLSTDKSEINKDKENLLLKLTRKVEFPTTLPIGVVFKEQVTTIHY
jgi:hypothetical protein